MERNTTSNVSSPTLNTTVHTITLPSSIKIKIGWMTPSYGTKRLQKPILDTVTPITTLGTYTRIEQNILRLWIVTKMQSKTYPHILSPMPIWPSASYSSKGIKMPSTPSKEPRNCCRRIITISASPTRPFSRETWRSSTRKARNGARLDPSTSSRRRH